jgi:hypothetical protein
LSRFGLIDRYLGTRLDIDVAAMKPGERVVAESPRRLQCEQSYGFVHALYGISFRDGRFAVSVTPGARPHVVDMLARKQPHATDGFGQDWLNRLAGCVSRARSETGLPAARGGSEGRLFACNGTLVRRYNHGDCRRLRDQSIPPVDGLRLPTHCFPNGIVYGIVEDAHIVSVAYAHRTGLMEDQVVDLGVETAAPFRRRGYAKTVVAAVTVHMTTLGGEALYTCSADNGASIATASRVGYELYGNTITVAAASPEVSEDQPNQVAGD